MNKSVMLVSFSLLSIHAFGLEIPDGKYQLVGQECTDGQPANPIVPSEMMESNMTAVLDFSALNFKMDASINYKLKGEFGQSALENYEQGIAELEKKPSTPENQEELNYLKSMYLEIKEMVTGRTCKLNLDVSYRIDESKMTSTINKADSDCKEFITGEMVGTKKIQIVSLKDDLLKLETAAESDDAKSDQCDFSKGARLIEIFKKVSTN